MAKSNRRLLFSITKKDLRIEYFSGSGAGGQHRNRHQNCVRLHHPASGAIVTGQSHRERKSNIKEALRNLVGSAKFKVWHARAVKEILSGKTIDEIVDESMQAKNLKIECRDENGKWKEEDIGESDG